MKIDLHVHTSEMSACGALSSEETINGYKEAGFDGIVITNHYNSWTQWWVYEKYGIGGDHYYEAYKKCWEDAARLGDKVGLRVFFGCELKTNNNNDYLLYGAPDEFLSRNNTDLWRMSAGDINQYAKVYGFLFYQAHPFRDNMQITNPKDLFGIEVKNANPRHNARNDIAACWADKYPDLHRISGSDCHQREDIAVGGIETDVDVKTTAELVEVLRNDRYTIL